MLAQPFIQIIFFFCRSESPIIEPIRWYCLENFSCQTQPPCTSESHVLDNTCDEKCSSRSLEEEVLLVIIALRDAINVVEYLYSQPLYL